ncbi:FHA domain/Protein kinase domain/Protein tyrosine kinase, putative [Leishmania lindenbergi]|uniref:FHA domain/Protein kinase domain/Protein tyrosine kinase n=2 Tax=Viannia TaxID=37616 RepID=A0AAW3AW11_9TRYP
MQPPRLKPALVGTAGTTDAAPPGAMVGASMDYEGGSGKHENTEVNPCSYEEGDRDARVHSADYHGHQRRPVDMRDTTWRRSSPERQRSVLQLPTSAASLSFPPPTVAAPTSSSYSSTVDGGAADRSASVPLSPAYSGRFNNRVVGDYPSHNGTGSSWRCCGSSCVARADGSNERVRPGGDACGSGCIKFFLLRRVGAALLSTTAQTAPGCLLVLIGVVTGVLLFLPWSSNPVHITLMVLSAVVGCVCGLVYWHAERRWRRRCYDARGAAAAYCNVGGAHRWHVQSATSSAAARYRDHDASDEGSRDETSYWCCCSAGCACHFIDHQHFRIVLPTVQLLLLGIFVLVSPQVMATWTSTTASTTELGGAAILADNGTGRETRYGARFYPVEVVWKTCLLHAWVGMGFSLPLLWALLVGLVHMAVLLAQFQHAGPGTLLTLVVWMSVPLLCLAIAMCIPRRRFAAMEERQQGQLLRVLPGGGEAAGYSTSYGAGAGAPLSLLASPSVGRSRDVFEDMYPPMYSPPSTVTAPASARAVQYHVHLSSPAVLPPPPVAAYSLASYPQAPSAMRAGGTYLARGTVGRYANLVRGGRMKMAAAQYDPIGLATPPDTSLALQHGQTRKASVCLYSPSSPSQAVPEVLDESAHDSIHAVGRMHYPTAFAAATLSSSGDGAHPSPPPSQASRRLAPYSRSPRASIGTRPTVPVRNVEPTPQRLQELRQQQQQQQHKHMQVAQTRGAEEATVLRTDAVDDDGAAVTIAPAVLFPPELQQGRRSGSADTAAAAQAGAAAVSTAVDEGCASGVDREAWYGELPMPAGTSLEDACAPYLVLDSALVIVDVSWSLCSLLGTTVNDVMFRRLQDVLAWLDVVGREEVVKLVSSVVQPLHIAAGARRGQKRGAADHPTRKENAKTKARKGRHNTAEDDVRAENLKGHNAQTEAAKQLNSSPEKVVRDGVADGAPVRRVTLRGRCPNCVDSSGSPSDSGTGRGGRRPLFAVCFDVWAERLDTPGVNVAGASSWTHPFSAGGGGQQSLAPHVIILRRPLLHGLCDALPLPVALVHPRTGEVLCWNRYAERLTGCSTYAMLGMSAYDSFVYEALPGAATAATSQGDFSSTGRQLPPPPPSPSVESTPSAHWQQRLPNTTALSAATEIGTVPNDEVASQVSALPLAKSASSTTVALLHPSQQTTPPTLSPLHGGAGRLSFAGQASPPQHAADLNDTFNAAALQQHRDAPLPGFFYVPYTRAAAGVAGVELALTSTSGDRGARLSSLSSTGGGPYWTSSPQLSWTLAGRGGTVGAAAGHADRLFSQSDAASQPSLFARVDVRGSGNKHNTSDTAVGAHCPRPPPPPPLAEGYQCATNAHDEAVIATAFEAGGNTEAREDGGDGDDDVRASPYRSVPAMARGLLFRATLRPLRGALCCEEGGVVQNHLGGPLRTSARAVAGEHASGRGAEESPFLGQPPRTAHASDNTVLGGEDAGKEQASAQESNQAGGLINSGMADGGEVMLSGRHRERLQQRHHSLDRTAADARVRNRANEEDSGAEGELDMADNDDDDDPFDEHNFPNAVSAAINDGLMRAATLEQLFATKTMPCNFGLDRESPAWPRRSTASAGPATAMALVALLSSELMPQYSLREALQQLATSEAPLLLTLSEPPVYATACASAELLLQEQRLSHRRASSLAPVERGCYVSAPDSHLGTPHPPQPPLPRQQRPQVPALWGDGSASLQLVAAVKEAVESYRESIEEDSSGYTDLLGLLSLSGDSGGGCPTSGYAARNSPSFLEPTPIGDAPSTTVTTAITADAVRQLRLLKSLSDQLLQATAAYNRTRQPMSFATRGLGGGVAGRMPPSSSSPSLSLGQLAAPAAPAADAAHVRYLNGRHPGSATTPSPYKGPPTSESLRVSAHQSPFQPPPPHSPLVLISDAAKGAHRRQKSGGPHRRQPDDPAASAGTSGSGTQTRIYRDPSGISSSVALKDTTGVAPSAAGGNENAVLHEPPPPPHDDATHPRDTGSGVRSDMQDTGTSTVKSRPRHAAKPSMTSVSRASHAGAAHGTQDGAAASTPAPSTPFAPSDSAVEAGIEQRGTGYVGKISGGASFADSPHSGRGMGRTIAATPTATSPFNTSPFAVSAGFAPAMASLRPPAMGAGVSALDLATPQTESNSSPPRFDSVLFPGDDGASGRGGAGSEDVTAAVGFVHHSATSPCSWGNRLLSPSVAAAEMAEVEGSHGPDQRQQRPQPHKSPDAIFGAGIGSGATAARREQTSPRYRSSPGHRRESSLDILPGAPVASGSFSGNGGLVPTSNSASPPAGAGAGGQGTNSSSPHPARPGSSSLNANATAAAAATAAVRLTPRRAGESAVWAVLVSRDEATIPSCCISVNLGEEFRLGRSSKCTTVVSDSFVSSTQFSIVRTAAASMTAQDLQSPGSGHGERGARRNKAFTVTLYDRSANGTYVNVKKLGKDKSCVLRDKALITFRLSTSQFFLGFVFILTDERGVPLDDRTGMVGDSGLRSLLDARLSPLPLTGRRNNGESTGGGGKESNSSQNTIMASPTVLSVSAARRNTPRALSTPDNSSFASGTPNGSRRAGGGAQRSSRHTHRETIEWKIGEEMLGKGGNAEVYLGINLTNGQLIAVKRVRLPTFAHSSDAEQDPEAKAILQQYRSLQEEISVLSKATHPNIVQYYGSSQNSTYFNILLEFVPGGSLRHLLDNFGALSPGVILSYVHQALEGLAYLHRHNIVHSDFKAANILITEKGKVKLTDFGTARLLNRPHATAAAAAAAAARSGGDAHSATSHTTSGRQKDDAVSAGAGGTLHVAGTLRWMDPALFHNAHSIGAADGAPAGAAKDSSDKLGGPTKAGDIWSVGCTMIEMMSGEAPWFEYDFESEEQIVNLLTYTAEPPETPECPECPDLVAIAQACLQMDPSRRPTCEELLCIVEEATARLQAQPMSSSVSPSREVSQQQLVTTGSMPGSGAGVRPNSATSTPQMEPGAGTAPATLAANPAAAYRPATDDRHRAERAS